MRALLLRASATFGVLSLTLAGSTAAFAEHTTRTRQLQQSGLDPWLMALTMAGIVVMLIIFAAVVLWWEHNDARQEAAAREAADPHHID